MSLQKVIEQAVANAFAAGAQWQAIRQGQDSATIRIRQWEQDHRYQQMVKSQQQDATEGVGRALMRVTLGPEKKQVNLFDE